MFSKIEEKLGMAKTDNQAKSYEPIYKHERAIYILDHD